MPSLETILIEFGILVLSLSFHEAAHAFTADRLGDPTARLLGRLTLNPLKHIDLIGTVVFPLIAMASGIPLLGWAKPVPVDMRHLREPRRDFAIVAAAGPASNLLLAAGVAMIYRVVAGTDDPSGTAILVADVLRFFIVINVFLATFNMIPVPPLDGGNVLMGLVPERVADVIGWLRPYGFLILYALMLTGALFTIVSPVSRVVLSWLL